MNSPFIGFRDRGSLTRGVLVLFCVAGLLVCGARARPDALPSQGTLVVAIPSKDGLVVAADTRKTIGGQYFDGDTKLIVVEGARPLLFAIAGTSEFVDPPPLETTLRNWLPRARVRYSGNTVVADYLRRAANFRLTRPELTSLGQSFARSLSEYVRVDPAALLPFRNRQLCQLVIFEVGPDQQDQVVGFVLLSVNAAGKIVVQPATLLPMRRQVDRVQIHFAGETEYAMDHVVKREGLRYFPPAVLPMLRLPLISEFTQAEADLLARTIISAAEKTSMILPIPSGNGIGGRVDAYLVRANTVIPIE